MNSDMPQGAAPQVSVVLTAYNRAEPLRRTLDSLLAQTFTDFELLICDDASPDHTADVANEYAARDSRVVYQRNPRNLGMPGNLNEGIRNSRGTFIANLHDGDLYDPTLLEKWASVLVAYPRVAFVFNQYRVLDGNGNTLIVHREDLPPVFPGARLLEEIFFRRWRLNSPVWGTVMARRAAYLENSLFDPRFGCIADVDMWMRLAEKYDVAYIAEPLISLVDHQTIPSNFKIPEAVLSRIYREARLRHYAGRPLRRRGELLRHLAFGAARSAWFGALLLRASLRASRS